MPEQRSINIGEDCLAKLDELIVVLKRARRKSFFSIELLDLIFDQLVNRDLKKAAKLAYSVRAALESFVLSLGEDIMLSPNMTTPDNCTETIDQFFDLVWDPPLILIESSIDIIKKNLEAVKNTRSAVLHLLGRV